MGRQGRTHLATKREHAAGETAPRRRPSEGGYAKGAETREKIIEAAYGVFAEETYLGASTRRIAAQAGVNPPALQYYFDSKEGLHRACGQALVERLMGDFASVLHEARAALESGQRATMIEAVCELMDRLADLMMPRAQDENWRRFLGRCQTHHQGPAYDLIEREFSAPLRELVTALVAGALGTKAEDTQTRLHAVLVLGQLSSLQVGADLTLNTLGWPDFAGDRAALIKKTFRDHVVRLLTAPLAGPATAPPRTRR